MSKNITYLLGAGASANALPTIASMADRMRYFHNLLELANQRIEDNIGGRDSGRNATIREFLDQINSFGTPDTVIRIDDIAGSAQDNIKRTFLAAYIIWEQLNECKEENERAFTADEEAQAWKDCFVGLDAPEFPSYHKVTLDPRYVEFLSSVMKPWQSRTSLPDNLKFILWNYDHQIEKALYNFESRHLHALQQKYRIAPLTNVDDRRWDKAKIESEYADSSIIKLNGTAGFVSSGTNSLFDPSTDSLNKRTWLKLLNLMYSSTQPGASMQKLMLAWDDGYEVINKLRRQASVNISESDVVVVIGYSFPNFNRWVDREIFKDFNPERTKLYIQDPIAEDIISKLDGVKTGLRDAVIPVESKGSFLLPNEFWE